MRKKIVKTLCMAGVLGMMSVTPALAAGWIPEADGRWWYQNEDGSYPVSEWKVIDEKEYYFDAEGYMASDTTIDGKELGSDGAVKVQSEEAAAAETASAAEAAVSESDSEEGAPAETEAEQAVNIPVQVQDGRVTQSDYDLALKTLKALYKKSDKANMIVEDIKCETFHYVPNDRVERKYRVCMITYGKNFSDSGSRFVGFYDAGVFETTTKPVAKFTGKTIREATDIVQLDYRELWAEVTG